MEDLYRVNKLIGALFHDPLKTLKLKTLASVLCNQKGGHDNALAHLL